MSNYYHLLAHLPDFVHIFRHCCSAVVTVNKSKCNFHSLFVKVSERLPELHANYFCIQCSVSAKVFAGDCCQFRAALHRNNFTLGRSQRQGKSAYSQRCAQLEDHRLIVPAGLIPSGILPTGILTAGILTTSVLTAGIRLPEWLRCRDTFP